MRYLLYIFIVLLPFNGKAEFIPEYKSDNDLTEEIHADSGYTGDNSAINDSTSSDSTHVPKMLDNIDDFMVKYLIYFPVPIVTFSTETSWLFGLTKFNSFTIRNGDTTDTETRASTLSELVYFTLNKQYKFVVTADIMFYKNKYLWTTTFVYERFPLQFYGVGNDADLGDQTILTTQNMQISTRFMFKTREDLYIGARYDFFNYYEVKLDSVKSPEDSAALATQLGIQSGIGPSLRWEGRDNRFNAKNGYFIMGEFQYYGKYLGSKFDFTKMVIDLRYYKTFFEWLTIAAQFYTIWQTGDVPVQSMALMGGSSRLRGIYEGSYRDKTMNEWQLELRFPIFWIFRGVVFGGMGQVAPGYLDFGFDRIHFAGGAGLRIRVDPVNDINLRIDFGWSKQFSGVYFGFAEAF